ncbi:MAG: S24 family peptidase, partial [Bacteroidia bacterium]|nr:S24 family peptidase [Bacteroidia bacterium]
FKKIELTQLKPYINAIPLYNIQIPAGNFSELQLDPELTWIEPPFNVSAKKGYFVCKVVGESMNKIIPNGSYCLFKEDEGGSRNGKIVLVESTSINDSEFGSGYTVKEYHSEKKVSDEGWQHESITLKPKSTLDHYEDIVLEPDELTDVKIRGIFVKVLEK